MSKTNTKQRDTSLEASLLNILSHKSNYDVYMHHVDTKRLLPNTSLLLKDYKKYYDLYPEHQSIDFNEFFTQFAQNWHSRDLEQTDIDYYKEYVLPAVENASNSDTQKVLVGLINKQYTEDMSTLYTSGIDVSKLRDLIDRYESQINRIAGTVDSDVHTVESVTFDVLDKVNGLPWFLPTLNQGLLPLSDGQFVIVSADFGTGKSAFVISQAVDSFKHLHATESKQPILFLNSEGTAEDVLGRFLSNLYRDDYPGGFEEIVDKRQQVKERFMQEYDASLFKVMQIATVSTFNQLKQKVQKYDPSLIIIDICDKLAKEEDVQSLKKLYDDLRVLASAGYKVIGTSQSGDTTYYDQDKKETRAKTWLGDHDLYGSKTGKGGAADSIITIGKDLQSNIRYVSVVKKKRGTPVRIVAEIQDIYSNYKEMTY